MGDCHPNRIHQSNEKQQSFTIHDCYVTEDCLENTKTRIQYKSIVCYASRLEQQSASKCIFELDISLADGKRAIYSRYGVWTILEKIIVLTRKNLLMITELNSLSGSSIPYPIEMNHRNAYSVWTLKINANFRVCMMCETDVWTGVHICMGSDGLFVFRLKTDSCCVCMAYSIAWRSPHGNMELQSKHNRIRAQLTYHVPKTLESFFYCLQMF